MLSPLCDCRLYDAQQSIQVRLILYLIHTASVFSNEAIPHCLGMMSTLLYTKCLLSNVHIYIRWLFYHVNNAGTIRILNVTKESSSRAQSCGGTAVFPIAS